MDITTKSIMCKFKSNWVWIVLVFSVLIEVVGNTVAWITGANISRDAMFILHAGGYMTEGAVPYVDFWYINPPLIFYLSWLIATIGKSNPQTMHLIATVLSATAVVSSSVVLSYLSYEITGDELVAIMAGIGLFILPGIYGKPVRSFHPEYFYLFFGLAGFYYIERNRSFTPGALMAISAGFYQPGIIISIISIGRIYQKRGRQAIINYVLGGVLITFLVLLPLLYYGALEAVFTEVMLVRLYTSSNNPIIYALSQLFDSLGFGILFIPIGLISLSQLIRTSLSEFWWVIGGGLSYFIKIFIDSAKPLDILMLMAFLSLGTSLLFHHKNQSRIGLAVIIILIISSGFWVVDPIGIIPSVSVDGEQSESSNFEIEGNQDELESLYMNMSTPQNCHYYLGGDEIRWLEFTNRSVTDSCGDIPWGVISSNN